MQCSTENEITLTAEHQMLLMQIRGDGNRVRPSHEISTTIAGDCDTLVEFGLVDAYTYEGVSRVRLSKMGIKWVQEYETRRAESMARAQEPNKFHTAAECLDYINRQLFLSPSEMRQVLTFILENLQDKKAKKVE